MGAYRFHDFILNVAPSELEARLQLPRLWFDLSWEQVEDVGDPHLRELTLHLHARGAEVPAVASPLFATATFSGFQRDDSFYLSDGESLLRVRPQHREANAFLASSFVLKPLLQQYEYWSFGLAMLL